MDAAGLQRKHLFITICSEDPAPAFKLSNHHLLFWWLIGGWSVYIFCLQQSWSLFILS